MPKYFEAAKWPSIKTAAAEIKKQEAEVKVFGHWQIKKTTERLANSRILTAKQIHGGNIVRAGQLMGGEVEADGIYVADENVEVGVQTADCAPVIIMTESKALALHVSRKTIVRGLLDNVLSYIEPKEIDYIYVGPHICEYHFSFIKEEYMIRSFRLRFGQAVHWHKGLIYLSIKAALQQFFTAWEVHPNKIHYDGRCTYEMLALPSYRRELDNGSSLNGQRLLTTAQRTVS